MEKRCVLGGVLGRIAIGVDTHKHAYNPLCFGIGQLVEHGAHPRKIRGADIRARGVAEEQHHDLVTIVTERYRTVS